MANVLHHHIEFHPRPVAHAPSPFSFGFGLSSSSSSMTPAWGAAPGHHNPIPFRELASSIQQSASSATQKRRREQDDDDDPHTSTVIRDESMDRSPTPERPKRAAPKRARVFNAGESTGKEDATIKDNKAASSRTEDDIDIGVLLASLPPESLMPLLSSLMKVKPELKPTILGLLPRPTFETANKALAQASRKLRDAFPYHNNQTQTLPHHSVFGSPRNSTPVEQQQFAQSGMRNSYIISRLRPHVTEFVSCCMSYLPYFTCLPPSISMPSSSDPTSRSHSTTTIQTVHKFHPSESFLFLSAVVDHVLSQPPLTIQELSTILLSRLVQEWRAWVEKVDEAVNKHGNLFGSEVVRGWERGLDAMADSKSQEIATVMRGIRDLWVSRVGWLVGRTLQHAMDV